MGQNWISLVIFILAFGAPAISWIFSKLKEQAEIKRERAIRQRQREEELRTGRRSDTSDSRREVSRKDDRATELQRLAERRQQQLRELRQRQAQQQGRQATGVAGAGMAAGHQQMPVPQKLPSRSQTRAEQARQRMQERIQQRQAEMRSRQQSQQPTPRTESRPTERPSSRPETGSRGTQPTSDIQAALRRSAEASALDQVSIQQQLREPPANADITKSEGPRRRVGVGAEVRGLLREGRRTRTSGPSLPALFAVSEVLSKPVSMRESDEGGGVTL